MSNFLKIMFGGSIAELVIRDRLAGCTTVPETCPVGECVACSVRECPYEEPLHYHHDGCPACAEAEP